MHIVHIISSVQQINFGIWNAALFASDYLHENHSIQSTVMVCSNPSEEAILPSQVQVIWVGLKPDIDFIVGQLTVADKTPQTTLTVSHGCWLWPSRLGYQLKGKGYRWLSVPHGMLEPWSRSQNRWKKNIYYKLFEKRYLQNADGIRAVSKTEQANLEASFKRKIDVVENGVKVPPFHQKQSSEFRYLFMARLHVKKGIVPLVKAWNKIMVSASAQLIIAGPDEGELEKIRPYLNKSITYVGAKYGREKEELLQESHYYVLPSFSEGFPTSVLEAMSYGLIPLISKGCNFPEVFDNGLGFRIEPDVESIATQLVYLKDLPFNRERSSNNAFFIHRFYSESAIGEQLMILYNQLFESR